MDARTHHEENLKRYSTLTGKRPIFSRKSTLEKAVAHIFQADQFVLEAQSLAGGDFGRRLWLEYWVTALEEARQSGWQTVEHECRARLVALVNLWKPS